MKNLLLLSKIVRLNFLCHHSLYLLCHGRVLRLVLVLYTLETFRARSLPIFNSNARNAKQLVCTKDNAA